MTQTRTSVVLARRSPVVPRGGAFAGVDLFELGASVLRDLLSASGLAAGDVDEVIVSNALGAGGNPARSMALAAGLPEHVGGLSLDRQCAGGLDALLIGKALIESGQARIVIAGGAESYSLRPHRFRTFADGRQPEPYEQARFTPWPEHDPDMHVAAARLAQTLGISGAAQDDWAVESHRKALSAQARIAASLCPVGEIALAKDPFTRDLNPAVARRARVLSGTITTANTAVAADGAAFCLLVHSEIAQRIGTAPVRLLGGMSCGGQPDMPGLAPVAAAKKTLARLGLAPRAVSRAEVMEAYAAQAIACVEGIGLRVPVVNPEGGALARGHPVGASGAVLAVDLVRGLQEEPGIGLAAIASAGGIGCAIVMES